MQWVVLGHLGLGGRMGSGGRLVYSTFIAAILPLCHLGLINLAVLVHPRHFLTFTFVFNRSYKV